MDVNWTEFKKFVDARQCSIQYVEVNRNYWMKAISGRFEIECFIPTDPNNEETAVFLASYQVAANKQTVEQVSPFAAKTLPNGKKLFKRVHGIQQECIVGENVFEFTIPYPQTKITGIEMVGGTACDTVNLTIKDTATGTYSTIPNYTLNQFGFTVNVAGNYYQHTSEYDADLYLNMKIYITYTAQTAGKIGINFILNELK
jgi:hypothetical protein